MWLLLVTLLVSARLQVNGNWPTLREVLDNAGVQPPSGFETSQRITSFSSLDDDDFWFVIGFYEVHPDGMLHELHVWAFDKRRERWRSVSFPEPIGSVITIQRGGSFFYLRGHSTLVLSESLQKRHALGGWPMLVLPDGRVVFERNMVQFAPAHSAILAIYDPRSNRETSFFPRGAGSGPGPEQVPGTDLWVDRTIGRVEGGGTANTIEFVVRTKRVTIAEDDSYVDVGPQTRQRIVCDVRPRVPSCTRIPD
jgi:hypothetical protein